MTKDAMEYLAPNRRMTPGQVGLFAEEIAGRYMHDSLDDVALFLRGVQMGKYGVDTYGALDPQRMFVWFAEYLAEKAEAMERKADKLAQEESAAIAGLLSGSDLKKAVDAVTSDTRARKEATEEFRRISYLQRTVVLMTDEQLREAWKLYSRAGERSIILREADARKLLKPLP